MLDDEISIIVKPNHIFEYRSGTIIFRINHDKNTIVEEFDKHKINSLIIKNNINIIKLNIIAQLQAFVLK